VRLIHKADELVLLAKSGYSSYPTEIVNNNLLLRENLIKMKPKS
jgi:hypothetical protein